MIAISSHPVNQCQAEVITQGDAIVIVQAHLSQAPVIADNVQAISQKVVVGVNGTSSDCQSVISAACQ